MQLIDIGANLTHESFRADFDAMLVRAHDHSVTTMVVTGATTGGSRAAVHLARSHPGVLHATAGVHPHHAIDYDDAADALLRTMADLPEVKAVGEAGLDYNRNYSPAAAQIRAFERQLEIAADCGKPVFLHQRDAHADFMATLKPFAGRLVDAVVHCFTGSREELLDYLDAGWHIGITGWLCDERRGLHLRKLVREIPADRLMIETDAPYLLPRSVRPQPAHRRNEPMYLRHIVEELARDRDEPVEVTATATTATARRFFRL